MAGVNRFEYLNLNPADTVWGEEQNETVKKRAFDKEYNRRLAVKQQKARFEQTSEKLDSIITEYFNGLSFNLGLPSSEELTQLIETDRYQFQKVIQKLIQTIIDGATIDWDEAQGLYGFYVATQIQLLQRVGRLYNPRPGFPQVDKPAQKTLEKPKPYKKRGKSSMHTEAAERRIRSAYQNMVDSQFRKGVTDEMAEAALNIERSTPLDELGDLQFEDLATEPPSSQ